MELDSMSKKRKVLLVFLCVFLLLVVPAGVAIFFLMPKFQVREFIEQEQVEYQEAMEYQAGDICYGNMFGCQDVEVTRV